MPMSGGSKRFGTGIAPDAGLLIIDMISPFDFEGAESLRRPAERAARVIRQLRDRFDRARAPVIYVNDNFMHWQGEFRDLLASCLSDGAPGRAIADLLQPELGHYYVLKPKHSAFHDTALEILLRQLKVKRLVLAGIATDSCILATAMDAHMREFPLWIPSDCTAAQNTARKSRTLSVVENALHANIGMASRKKSG
jgi:nicotinamidase-related amidase